MDPPSPHTHTFGILQLWITIDASVADIAVSRVEDVGQLTRLEWAGHAPDKDGLAWVDGLGVVHDVVAVGEQPGTNLHLREEREGGRGGKGKLKLEVASVLVIRGKPH